MRARNIRAIITACATIIATPLAHAGDLPFNDDGCMEGPLAQFGRYIGDWQIEDSQLAQDGSGWIPGAGARWIFTCLGNGTAIQDFWLPPNGSVGTNLRTWNPDAGKWDIAWAIDSQPGFAHIEAQQDDTGNIVMHYVAPLPTPLRRITFFPPDESGWDWQLEFSNDGGESWLVVYRIRATPMDAGAEDPLARGIDGDVTVTPGSVWTIDDGVLIPGRGEARSYIVTKKQYTDAEITLEFNPDPGTNSGVFARCQDPANITPIDCYEFNIWDAHPQQDARTGAIFGISPPAEIVATEGKWNTMRIRLEGPRLRVWVNGALTNDVNNEKLGAGYVALQYGGEGGMVKFRNIRIAELD